MSKSAIEESAIAREHIDWQVLRRLPDLLGEKT